MTARELKLLDVSVAGRVPPATLARVLASDMWPRADTGPGRVRLLDIDPPEQP